MFSFCSYFYETQLFVCLFFLSQRKGREAERGGERKRESGSHFFLLPPALFFFFSFLLPSPPTKPLNETL